MKTIKLKANKELGPNGYDVIIGGNVVLSAEMHGLKNGTYDLDLIFDQAYGRVLWTCTKGDGKGFKIVPRVGYNPEKHMMVTNNPLVIGGVLEIQKSRDGMDELKSCLRGERKAKLQVGEPKKAAPKKPAAKKAPAKKAPAKKTVKKKGDAKGN